MTMLLLIAFSTSQATVTVTFQIFFIREQQANGNNIGLHG